jgi:hypothetical protein
MKKLILALITAGLFLAGCDSSNGGNTSYNPPPQPVQPVQPVQPIPTPEPEKPTIPTAGVGSIKGDMDCSGGTITTNYSFGNVQDDSKNFLIQYERNGVVQDLTYPSTSTTGSRTIVKDIYYAGQNDKKSDVYWIVTITYQTSGEIYELVSTTIKQPACDDNATARVTTYSVK